MGMSRHEGVEDVGFARVGGCRRRGERFRRSPGEAHKGEVSDAASQRVEGCPLWNFPSLASPAGGFRDTGACERAHLRSPSGVFLLVAPSFPHHGA